MLTLSRGSILKCRFPFDSAPGLPGPNAHYCMFSDMHSEGGQPYFAVAYGTSRLDPALISAHGTRHGILSIGSTFIRGAMTGPVTHFIARHVAIVPISWVYSNFSARLDFMRPEARTDQHRLTMYRQFEAFEEIMDRAALSALNHFLTTGQPGLPPGALLRPRD